MDEETLAEIAAIDQELAQIEEQITDLKCRRIELQEFRETLVDSHQASLAAPQQEPLAAAKDYSREDFEWSAKLKDLAKSHWNIVQWRDKQLQVMNASLDQKDTFVIMPTGGGKSLCYQLPALVSPGITLVVSPLLSLIRDQAFHLEEASIGVGMLTSNTTKEETKRIMEEMLGPVAPKETKRPSKGTQADKASSSTTNLTSDSSSPALKLVYVTPEKISKSKRLMSHLEKVYANGRLSRIVVDECHCCSNLGHDFRPDYKKLGILRVVFPNVPIMALTATSPPNVTQSVLTTLNMPPLQQAGGTLLFDAPLFRPNLAYRVISRPNSNQETFKFLVDYIQKKHEHATGIIYCLSKKDTHVFAEGISAASGGRIITSAYHADIDDQEKEQIHELWREGHIQVVCATIAFGLGINHPNVRYVIHVCMAKSVEGYYQESGRAGRDGLAADCLLLYREQDAARLSTLCISEPEGIKNVYSMIKYAQDLRSCRHQLFDVHFSKYLSTRLPPCGFCDNCVLQCNDVVTEDLKVPVNALCRLLEQLKDVNERVTLNKLVEAWRGLGSLRVIAKAVREEQNVEVVPKRANKDDYDRIINHLIVHEYLREDFHFTAYSTLAYILNGPKSRPFLVGRPLESLSSILIDFGRDSSRDASAGWDKMSSKVSPTATDALSAKRKAASIFVEESPSIQTSYKRSNIIIDLSGDGDDDDFA